MYYTKVYYVLLHFGGESFGFFKSFILVFVFFDYDGRLLSDAFLE